MQLKNVHLVPCYLSAMLSKCSLHILFLMVSACLDRLGGHLIFRHILIMFLDDNGQCCVLNWVYMQRIANLHRVIDHLYHPLLCNLLILVALSSTGTLHVSSVVCPDASSIAVSSPVVMSVDARRENVAKCTAPTSLKREADSPLERPQSHSPVVSSVTFLLGRRLFLCSKKMTRLLQVYIALLSMFIVSKKMTRLLQVYVALLSVFIFSRSLKAECCFRR